MYSKTFSFFKVVVKHTYHKRHFSYFLNAQFINCFYSVGFVKNPPANAGNNERHGFDPWVGKIPGGGHVSPLQYSCLENPTDTGAWWVQSTGLHRIGHD